MSRRGTAVLRSVVVVLLLFGFVQIGHPQAAHPQAAHPQATHVQGAHPGVDWEMVAKIREEGLQRSELADTLSYMTDVLGARLTLSAGMTRAQEWAMAEMARIGMENIVLEPFMDYGVSWENEYVSLHLLEPDYQPMVGFPLAHTSGTDG